MAEQGLSKREIIAVLTRSPHASAHAQKREQDPRTPAERLRDAYLAAFGRAMDEDPDFYAHLIAWNHTKGEVRDAKAALPVIALRTKDPVFAENALAHMADFNPRLLVKALDFNKLIGGPKNMIHRFVTRYLRDLEADRREFETVAVQHRASLRRLYTFFHVNAAPFARSAVVEARSVEGKFGIVKQLPSMSPLEIVAAIDTYKLPWLVVRGALGAKAKDPDVLMAFLTRMTAADLATSAKWLVRAGVKDHPQTRAAFEELLTRAGKPHRARGAVLKASKAAKVLEDLGEEKISGRLRAVQEQQIEHLRTIEGNWVVFGDKSGSMERAIDTAKRVATILARTVKGQVYLVFFDTDPRPIGNVSGLTLDALEQRVRMIRATGGTSIGCGLRWLADQKILVDGIAIVSDGGENTPPYFATEYQLYCRKFDTEPTVYLYQCEGDANGLSGSCSHMQIDLQTYDIRKGVDDYSLPNLVTSMRIGRYSLIDEIMTYRLRTLDDVLTRTVGTQVLAQPRNAVTQ